MESATDRLLAVREIVIDARPETVWQFLVDPEKIARWKGRDVQFEAQTGARYRNEIVPGQIAAGEIVELDPPHRLVYTWGWEGNPDVPPGSSTVEYELLPEGDGTRVRLTHRDLPSTESVDAHAHGWEHYLERLAVVAAGGDPGPDQWMTERSS